MLGKLSISAETVLWVFFVEYPLEENFVGEKELEEKTEEKYLGGIISNDGRYLKKEKSRIE